MGWAPPKHNNFFTKEVRLYTHFWLYNPSFERKKVGLSSYGQC